MKKNLYQDPRLPVMHQSRRCRKGREWIEQGRKGRKGREGRDQVILGLFGTKQGMEEAAEADSVTSTPKHTNTKKIEIISYRFHLLV
jgi:hypothetical protein